MSPDPAPGDARPRTRAALEAITRLVQVTLGRFRRRGSCMIYRLVLPRAFFVLAPPSALAIEILEPLLLQDLQRPK
jgi:hypothetical protein